MSESEQAPESVKQLPSLAAHARRVLGVLVEKAKTTPDSYPMTLNGIVVACNQKSNRAPQMQLGEGDVQIALDQLRSLGAVAEIQGSGRVSKFRHLAYDWLGVRGAEAAIVVELLLRGPQTVGELRSRASRMEATGDLQATTAHVEALIEKGLVVALTPAGRGQQFAHTLYAPIEISHLKEKVAAAEVAEAMPAAMAVASDRRTDTGLAERLDSLTKRVAELERIVAQIQQA